jgi:hypothetical protein
MQGKDKLLTDISGNTKAFEVRLWMWGEPFKTA